MSAVTDGRELCDAWRKLPQDGKRRRDAPRPLRFNNPLCALKLLGPFAQLFLRLGYDLP